MNAALYRRLTKKCAVHVHPSGDQGRGKPVSKGAKQWHLGGGGGERQHERGAPVKEIGSARAEGSSQRRKKHGEKDRKVTGVCRNRQTGRADGGKRERERDGARTPRWKDKGTFTAQLKAFRI